MKRRPPHLPWSSSDPIAQTPEDPHKPDLWTEWMIRHSADPAIGP
jgi:hypothetical protein